MMEIVFLRRHQIDSSQWDNFVSHSSDSIIYAFSWYLDTVTPEWGALIQLENHTWKAVMPLPLRSKWGFEVIQQPFFCQLLGIFSAVDFCYDSSAFFQALTKHFRYISVYTGRLSMPPQQLFPEFEITLCHTHTLKLDTPHDIIQKRYSLDRKKNLQRSLVYKWVIQESIDIETIIDLFAKNHAGNIEGGVATESYHLLRQLYKKLLSQNAAKLYYALQDNQIEAGILLAIYQGRIIYLFNAASVVGRRGNARTWMIDRILADFAQSGYIFDFESPEQLPIATFYRSFGAIEEPYWKIKYNNLPFLLRHLQKMRIPKKAPPTTEGGAKK